MAIDSTLLALLEAEEEPTVAVYKNTVNKLIRDPEQISRLTDTNVKEDVIVYLEASSERLVYIFHGLRVFSRANPKPVPTSRMAAGIATFLAPIIPALHERLSPTKVLGLLTPAVEICLTPSQPPPLRKIVSIIAGCGRLLEYLASDPCSSQTLHRWVHKLGTSALDAPTLDLWTERLMKMVGTCQASQDVVQTMQQYHTLRDLKSHLRDLEAEHSGEPSEPIAQQGSLPLGNMTQLSKDDKKTRTGAKEPKTLKPTLDENTKADLKLFDLPDPESWAALRDVIEKLEGDENLKALLSVLTHFPCDLCIQGLGSSPRSPDARTLDTNIEKAADLRIEILGRALWVWQILLSVKAFRSLQEMSSQGTLSFPTACAVVTNIKQVLLVQLAKS